MSEQIADAVEFRCNRCWQTNFASVDLVGHEFTCQSCAAPQLVPEATPQRLRLMAEIQASQTGGSSSAHPEISPYASDATLMKLVRSESDLPLGMREFRSFPDASLFLRLLAAIIDTAYLTAACAAGLLLVIGAVNLGILEATAGEIHEDQWIPAMLVFYFIPLVATIIQWNLIAARGQTLGKYVTCIRIVTVEGKLPGFFQGVVLRNWMCRLLALIPLFPLIDCLVVFGGARRCIHDYLAGTRVVPAW